MLRFNYATVFCACIMVLAVLAYFGILYIMEGIERMSFERKFKREHKIVTCDECGKEFSPRNRPDGLPNGVGFLLEDGKILNICADCIIEMGKKNIE